jgi:uncharacterized protein HemX
MKDLMKSIDSTIKAINDSECYDLKSMLMDHLKHLLELQRATICRYKAGEIVWSE